MSELATSAPVRVRVLLADDHRMLREGLRRSLESGGLTVTGEAADGEEAVRLAEARIRAVEKAS